MEIFVEPQIDSSDACDELDRAVVVRRPESAGDDAQIGAEAFPQRILELLLGVANDLDARRLEAEAQDLAR